MTKVLLTTIPIDKNKLIKGLMAPIGLAKLAGNLLKYGHETKITDLATTAKNKKDAQQQLKKEIQKYNPDILGISYTTETRMSAYETSKYAKQLNPNLTIIHGGPHATFCATEILLNTQGTDIVVIGEGEDTIVDIADNHQKNLKDIPGIVYKTKEDTIIKNPQRPLEKNLDKYPWPAYELLNFSLYTDFKLDMYHELENYDKPKTFSISTSFGCPYKCKFCSVSLQFGATPRSKSPEKVLEEIRYLHEEKGINMLYFLDENQSMFKQKTIQLCDLMQTEKMDIKWITDVRVNEVNKELLTSMKKAGCYLVAYGAESGNNQILKNLNKKTTTQMITDANKLIHESQLMTKAYFIYGSPGETETTFLQTKKFMEQLNSERKAYGIMRVYPGTEIEQLHNQSLKLQNKPPQNWTKPHYEKHHLIFGSAKDIPIYNDPNGLGPDGLAKLWVKHMIDKSQNRWTERGKKAIKLILSGETKSVYNYAKRIIK